MRPWPDPVYAVDSSFDRLTPEEAQGLKAAGIELFIQCLWTGTLQPQVRVENLRVASEGGLAVAGYSSLTATSLPSDGTWHMRQGRRGVPDDLWEQLAFVAVDVELPGIQAEAVLDAARYTKNSHEKRTIIYTNFNSWTTKIRPKNSALLSGRWPSINTVGYPLWNAYWDGDSDVDFPSLPFGGWKNEQVVGEQWSGGTYVGGQFVDRNTFRRDFVFPREDGTVEPENPDKLDADLYKLAAILRAAAELTEEGIPLPVELRNMLAYVGIVWPDVEGEE